ncbi:phage portal protein [Azospirillum sp.]|uniref:phage portal protein n=1 Tax=Azospirillum sp. TaxID=34012 RepID=UPI003D70D323
MSKPDDAKSVAFDPAAPASERYDARAELERAHRPLASELLPSSDIQPVIDYILNGLEEQDMLLKARGNLIQFPGRVRPPPKRGMQSVYLDDLQIFAHGEYFEKPSPLGFDTLRTMVDQTPVLNSVILTRIRQISRFTQPSEDGGPGFEIRHVDRKHQLSDEEQNSTQLLAKFFQHNGWEFNPRRRKIMRRDNFTGLMAKLVRDSLTMDSAPIECEMKRDRSLGIDGLYAVDGATIRLCAEDGYEGDDEVYALQVVQGRIATAYTRDTLIYEVRNPRTDVRLAGYGLGETELLVRVVTGFLNAMSYNIAGFDQNAIPRGLLHLSGDYATEDMTAFRRYWNAMVKGINNAWALPVMVSKDQESKASFERFGVEFNEMYFSKWMTFLTSIICAIYGMAPDEINFESFSSQKSSLSGSDTAERLADSKDKGLRPLMSYFESLFTDFVVSEFSDKYCFRWVGLDPADEAREWEAKKLILTVDELRAEKGYDGHPDKQLGQAPINPSLIGPWMQLNQPPQQGQDFGGQGGDALDFGEVPEDEEDGGGGKPPPGDAGQGKDNAPAGRDDTSGGDFGGGGDADADFGKALQLHKPIWAVEP